MSNHTSIHLDGRVEVTAKTLNMGKYSVETLVIQSGETTLTLFMPQDQPVSRLISAAMQAEQELEESEASQATVELEFKQPVSMYAADDEVF